MKYEIESFGCGTLEVEDENGNTVFRVEFPFEGKSKNESYEIIEEILKNHNNTQEN